MLNKILNKLRSLSIFFILTLEFIFSGFRVILFSVNEIVDFEVVLEPNKDFIEIVNENRSQLENLESKLYSDDEYIHVVEENDDDENF